MSDLAATNCGNCGCDNNNNGCNILFLFLILSCCGNGCGNFFNGSGFFGDNDCGCNTLIWILLLCCFCGNGF